MRFARDDEFRDFVLSRRPGLVRTATLLTAGDSHLAEDLVQTTLARLYASWSRVRRAENPDAYARRALINTLVDETRRPWRRERPAADVTDRAAGVEPTAERTEALHLALRKLPPRMRATLVYRYFHDLSVAQTADALSCSQGTVKSQTARALNHLRSELGQLEALDNHDAAVDKDAFPHSTPPVPRGRSRAASPTNTRNNFKEYRHV